MKTYKPNENIKDVFNRLKKDFKVYAYKDNFTDFIIEQDDVGIAYISKDYFSGFNLSTKHKPCTEAGTGYILKTREADITKADALLAIAATAPVWDKKNLSKIRKYKSFKDYISLPVNQILKYQQV